MILLPVLGTKVLSVELWVPGKPSQWSRGTTVPGKIGSFIVKKDKDRKSQSVIGETWQNWIRVNPEKAHLFPHCGPVTLQVASVYRIAKKKFKKKTVPWGEKLSAPDVSNLLKQPEDALRDKENRSGFPMPYNDDAQIVQVYSSKHYHPSHEGMLLRLEFYHGEDVEAAWVDPLPWEEPAVMDMSKLLESWGIA